uniref:(northern house mosquito) hypothetical protein n=1 Tax=Culex pipiens TaxID=7175 RepID=A0A8D8BTE7_CULPI
MSHMSAILDPRLRSYQRITSLPFYNFEWFRFKIRRQFVSLAHFLHQNIVTFRNRVWLSVPLLVRVLLSFVLHLSITINQCFVHFLRLINTRKFITNVVAKQQLRWCFLGS